MQGSAELTELIERFESGDRRALSRIISHVEDHREGFEKILGGEIPAEITEDWGDPSRGYGFDDFDVLTKMPGARGIRLFDYE